MHVPWQGTLRDTTSCDRVEAATFCSLYPWNTNKADQQTVTVVLQYKCAPPFSGDLRVKAGWEQTRWADWPQVLLEEKHLLFQRDPKTKKTKQQKINKKRAVKGVSSSVLLQPRWDEMLHWADSGPSRNNSRKCQASVSEMRSAEVSGAFCRPSTSLSEPPDRLHMHSGRMRTRSRDTIEKPLLCVHISCILLGVCYAWRRTVLTEEKGNSIVQTHWQPQK